MYSLLFSLTLTGASAQEVSDPTIQPQSEEWLDVHDTACRRLMPQVQSFTLKLGAIDESQPSSTCEQYECCEEGDTRMYVACARYLETTNPGDMEPHSRM